MAIPDETPLDRLLVLSSHNSQQGRFQACVQPNLEHLETCLDLGCRALEIDVSAGKDDEPLVRHGVKCGGLRLGPVLHTILDRAFENTSHPLFLFVDLKTRGNKRMLDKAAQIFVNVLFEDLLLVSHKGLTELTYGEVKRKVVVVSYPMRTESKKWNALVVDSPYSERFLNVSDRRWPEVFKKERPFVRVYPKNLIFSRNFDPTPMLREANFVAMNVARGGKHMKKAIDFFKGSDGILVKNAETWG